MEWLIPILASVLGGVATAGVSSALAPDAPKPKYATPKLGSLEEAKQPTQAPDPMSDDILQRFLQQSMQRKGALNGSL